VALPSDSSYETFIYRWRKKILYSFWKCILIGMPRLYLM
jgi:hypothetical protein